MNRKLKVIRRRKYTLIMDRRALVELKAALAGAMSKISLKVFKASISSSNPEKTPLRRGLEVIVDIRVRESYVTPDHMKFKEPESQLSHVTGSYPVRMASKSPGAQRLVVVNWGIVTNVGALSVSLQL